MSTALPTGVSAREMMPAPFAALVEADGRLYLSGLTAERADGTIEGLGDPAIQADATLRKARSILEAHGSSLEQVCKATVAVIDRDVHAVVENAIGRHLSDTTPCRTDFVAAALGRPELLVELHLDAVKPGRRVPKRLHRSGPAAESLVLNTPGEIFVSGQIGVAQAGDHVVGVGRRLEDAAHQAELALLNLKTALTETGSAAQEICKITVAVPDRAYREAVYPVIGRQLEGVFPVSTGIVVRGFARPEILFQIDAVVVPRTGSGHRRIRTYHTSAARYGLSGQKLDCGFCMAVRAGRRVYLRGQTGVDLDERMHGLGDPAVQAEQAMENVRVLLADAGAAIEHIVKTTLYVTDRAFLKPAMDVISRHLSDRFPAFSCFVVEGLASPELLVEIDITAVVPEDRV